MTMTSSLGVIGKTSPLPASAQENVKPAVEPHAATKPAPAPVHHPDTI